MKINKEFVIKSFRENFVIGLIILLIFIGSYWFLIREKQIDLIVPMEQYNSDQKSEEIVRDESVDKLLKQNELSNKLPSESINSNIEKPTETDVGNPLTVSLTVLKHRYLTNFEIGETLFDLMNKLKSDTKEPFIFNYKEHSGLGIFVTEINGVSESPGKYWLYYVNNKEASVGVRDYILKAGDSIEWRQE